MRKRRRQGRIEYQQPDGSWSTKKPTAKPAPKPTVKPTAAKPEPSAAAKEAAAKRAVRAVNNSKRLSIGRGTLLTAGLQAANAIQDRLLSPAALARKRENEISKENFYRKPIDSSKYDMDRDTPVKPAEKKPAKPPVKASEQKTTTTSSSTRQSAPAKRDTRNDEYNSLRIKANKSGSAEDRKAAESAGMKAWRKANPKLAAELDRKEAEKRRKRDKGKSGAVRAGWDGNKNY